MAHERQCEECFEKFGSLMFGEHAPNNATRGKRSRLMCQNCQTTMRCGKCKTAYLEHRSSPRDAAVDLPVCHTWALLHGMCDGVNYASGSRSV